jgi:hypothetical protein
MTHYLFATSHYTDSPGFIEVDGERIYVDTASSTPLLDDDHDATLVDHGVRQVAAAADWRFRRSGRRWRLATQDRPHRLRDCRDHGVGRDLSTSSGTVAGVVTAAQISLRGLGRLREDEAVSVSALEEFTTVLQARTVVSTIYSAVAMARQVGFLRERHVDGLSNRFLGQAPGWKDARLALSKFVYLNTPSFKFDANSVRSWLHSERPVIARVNPLQLLDLESRSPLGFTNSQITDNTHHTVTIVDQQDDLFVVRSGWRNRPFLAVPVAAPSEAWGLLLEGEDERDGDGLA